MVHRSTVVWITTGLALLACRTAMASAITLTGNVEVDFPASNPAIAIIVSNPDEFGNPNPNSVAQHPDLPGITGWNIKDLRLAYDGDSDRMYVGLNFWGVAGDADGDGIPGHLSMPFGRDEPSLGGLESITVWFDTNNDGTPNVVAGVPANKPSDKPGVEYFSVSEYRRSSHGISSSYGSALTDHPGELAFDPSPEHPDFQFFIDNFKALPALDPAEGFTVGAFAGSSADIIAGEDFVPGTHVSFPAPLGQEIPEPATLLAWSVMLGTVSAWGWHRRRRMV